MASIQRCNVRNSRRIPKLSGQLFLLLQSHPLLPKQLPNSSHRQEESSFYLGQIDETVFPIERKREIVLGVHDNTGGCSLFAQVKAAPKSVHQQCFTDSLRAKFCAHGEPTEKGCRNHGIFG
jgi:hypothetical protein